MKLQASQLNFVIGDLAGNGEKIIEALSRARKNGADLVLFSELAITGYPPEDLLLDSTFVESAWKQLQAIIPHTKGLCAIIGLPRKNPHHKDKPLHNSAAVCVDGQLIAFADKILLPTYDVFDERRFFEPGEKPLVFSYKGFEVGVTICEDAWQHSGDVGYANYARDPINELSKSKIDLLLNLSASPYSYKRGIARAAVFQAAAETLQCPVLFCNQVGANDQILFDGHSLAISSSGELLGAAKGFVEEDLVVDLDAPARSELLEEGIHNLYQALVMGLRDYFTKQGFTKAILGLSGGIDSALVACIAVDAIGASNVTALALPTRFSSHSSHADAALLAKNINLSLQLVSIEKTFQHYLDLLDPFIKKGSSSITEENLQSRIRGMILMAFSNAQGSLLLNTGNKSEMAMGYTTLYGDMCGGLGPLHDVTKLHIYELARYVNREREIIPNSILEKAPSAELKENQTDQDTLPPYEVLDPILEDYIERGLSPEEIAEQRGESLELVTRIVKAIHRAEYKRRQAPIGLRVTQKAFSRGRNVPVVQRWW